ncbi:MAG: class I SAM-dependent methyltransferase [Nitrospinota bacterium]
MLNRKVPGEPAAKNRLNDLVEGKYAFTSVFYDFLDYPWERMYRKWRPGLLRDVDGTVFEAGVGTGRNLEYYSPGARVIGADLSRGMLARAKKRAENAPCQVTLIHEDVTKMKSVPSAHFDWVFSSFLCCVMPDALQPLAIGEFSRILKPGGRFRVLEMVYSRNEKLRKRQDFFAPFVEKVFGARFDRNTVTYLMDCPTLKITGKYFLKKDVYLVIEGTRL